MCEDNENESESLIQWVSKPVARREMLRAGLLGAGVLFLGRASLAQACGPSCEPTEDNIEGPYYVPGAPRRSDLVTPTMQGTRLQIAGRVLDDDCGVRPGALIEIWQADASGHYDADGFTLRGAMLSDAAGGFRLNTIVPGRYLNGDRYRPAHIHVKVHSRGCRPLTTQLYFAGDPYNEGDAWIRQSLVMNPQRRSGSLYVDRDLVLSRA